MKVKSFCTAKEAMEREKIFANHISDKGLIAKIYKVLIQLNGKNHKWSNSKMHRGTSLAVQCLRLCTSTAGGMGLIPGRGTRILHATHCGQKNF